MALVLADRIRETTTTTGTDAYTLAGAETGFETFATIGNGNTTYYCCTDGVDFEIGIGEYTLSGTTLSRTILQSSNSDSAVSWANGTRSIFCTQPAEKAVFLDASGNASLGGTITATGVTLGDAEAILLGASSDMQIIHDGSNSIIADNGTGNLVLRSNSAAVEIDFNTNETSALFNHNGSVELYHNSSKKFETTSGGVTVTGEIAATSLDISGDIDVDGTTNLNGVDIDGAVDMATTLQVDGVATFTGRDIHSGGITIANAGQIGSVGDLDAIAIASNGVVTFSQIPVLPANSIDSDVYVDGSIDNAHIADDAIDSEHYADGSIDTAHIANLQITTGLIAADAITAAKIADDAIDSEHYADGSIDTAHIANLQITTGLIAADAITAAKIADDVIDSEHYAAGSIDTEHIADANVTLAKIANQAANTVLVRDANSSGVVSAKAVATTQILIGDGTGFTAAALSGDVTMTNAGAVTIAATSVEGSMLNTNVISGQTELASGLALTDELFVSDAGELKRMAVSVLTAVTDDNATALAIALG